MAARENLEFQVAALERVWRWQLRQSPAQITAQQLAAYAIGAGAVMVDGSEVIRVGYEGGSTDAQVMYPKEVVMTAAMNILESLEDGNPLGSGADPSVVHADLSKTRIET